jgi:hypothetical protein
LTQLTLATSERGQQRDNEQRNRTTFPKPWTALRQVQHEALFFQRSVSGSASPAAVRDCSRFPAGNVGRGLSRTACFELDEFLLKILMPIEQLHDRSARPNEMRPLREVL